jgi:hypothetical protein
MYLLYDKLVMTYAVVELSLHTTEHLLRYLHMSPFLSVSLRARVLL